MTTGLSPYVTPSPLGTDPASTTLETVIIASHEDVDIGDGLATHASVERGQHRALDLVIIASHVVAVALQHIQLMRERSIVTKSE